MKSSESSWGLVPMFEPQGHAAREISPPGDTQRENLLIFNRDEDESERHDDDDELLDSRR